MSDLTQETAIFQNALDALRRAQKPVAILGHLRPDGDCVGAQVALCRVLKAQGVDAFCVNAHPLPANLKDFIGDTPYRDGIEQWTPPKDALAITVDCTDNRRYGTVLADMFPDIFLAVDHHLDNRLEAPHKIVDPQAAATCEILARVFLAAKLEIDPVCARALYAGIATDTGQFKYAATTRETFLLAAELVARGASPNAVSQSLYEHRRPQEIALLKRALASLRFYCGGRLAVICLSRADFEETGAVRADAEDFINIARCVDGVEMAASFEDFPGKTKCSLRARREELRVDLLAKKFGGGGHAAAAGFNLAESFDSAYPRWLKAAEARLAEFFGGK